MKFSSKLFLSILSVGLSSQLFADDIVLAAKKSQKAQAAPAPALAQQDLLAQNTQNTKKKKNTVAPGMRKYKECETGLAYTFSRVTLGGLDNLPAFVNLYGIQDPTPGTTPKIGAFFKNMELKDVWEFNYNYLQTLEDSAHKVFFDLNYIHADGNTKSPLIASDGNANRVHPFYGASFDSTNLGGSDVNLPLYSSVKSKFDLSSAQSGVSMRLFRTKNIDFSVFGGADAAYYTYTSKINLFGAVGAQYQQNAYVYSKSSENVSTVNDKSTMNALALSLDAKNNGPLPYTQSVKNHFYGAGPLLGAKLQVPFNREYLRLNIKAEASALMGWGKSALNYDYTVLDIDSTGGSPTSATSLAYYRINSEHRHVFRLIPTLRGEISLDVIIKNFMFTAGLQQAVYFQAIDISPLVDLAEFNANASNASALTTRDRFGQLVTGGAFLKASLLF